MERYNKYLVLKVADIEKHLSDEDKQELGMLVTRIRLGRLKEGKSCQQYVCIAADWPMYETVWEMVESCVDGKPDELTTLRDRVAELEQLAKEMAEALNGAVEWDKRRKFILPYSVRDPIHAAQKRYREVCGGEK